MNTRFWCLAVAVGAITATASVARADVYSGSPVTSVTTTTTTTTTGLPPIVLPEIVAPPIMPDGSPVDYSVLDNPTFTGVDLKVAHMDGFTDRQIREMIKIASEACVPFDQVRQMVLDGKTLPQVALWYDVPFGISEDARDYKYTMDDYRVAYANTGEQAFENLVAGSQQELVNGTMTNIPEAGDQSAYAIIANSPELSMFAGAIRQANLESVFRSSGALTVFAPTNDAFNKLDVGQLSSLMNNQSALIKFIDYLVIPQRIDAADAMAMTSPTSPATLEGDTLQLNTINGSLQVNGANIVKPDVYASNGVVHEIDTVLMPPTVTTTASTTTTTTSTYVAPAPAPTTSVAPAPAPAPNGDATPAAPSVDTSPSQ